MRAYAQAQPNIALVKYWGKHDAARNLPAVGSQSITLEALWTRMRVDFSDGMAADSLQVNGRPADDLLPRVSRCLDRVAGTKRRRAEVVSETNFPVGAGLASSASAFAALVVAASAAAGRRADRLELARLAGAESGSAARSLYAGFVELETGDEAIGLRELAAPADWPLEVVVAVTATAAKPVSSGEAMIRSERTSPFYPRWLKEQPDDLRAGRSAIAGRDFDALAELAEHNCLKMHSLTWTSRPAVVYWNDVTLSCMQAIQSMRNRGVGVFFTVDAGPQVKAVCLPGEGDRVAAELGSIDGVVEVLRSGLGRGAMLLDGE